MGTGESGIYYTSDGSDYVHHGSMIHSAEGEYTHDVQTGRPKRLKNGGHMQAAMDLMKQHGIEFNVVRQYWNGVRVGDVPNHKNRMKRTGTMQTWFPRSWTTRDIVKEGDHVSMMKKNRGTADGVTMWGTYKNVRVGVIKTNGQVATVFPDRKQPAPRVRRKRRGH